MYTQFLPLGESHWSVVKETVPIAELRIPEPGQLLITPTHGYALTTRDRNGMEAFAALLGAL